MRRFSSLAAIAFAVVLGSCNSTDLPTAPNLQPVLDAYENPTVEVGREIMEEWADDIADAAEGIEDSEIFREILHVISEVQTELEASTAKACSGGTNEGDECDADTDCPDGTCVSDLVLGGTCSNDGSDCAADADCPKDGTCGGGVILPSPTGAVRINYICPGWNPGQFDPDYLKTCKDGANDGSACTVDADCPDGTCVEGRPDSANGSIDLFMTLDSGGIGRVVWGTAVNCLYLVPPPEGSNCEAAGCPEASYDGGIAVDLGPDWVDANIEMLPVTFVVNGTIVVDDDDFPIDQSFRLILAVESGLEILVDIGEVPLEKTFNYIFAGETQLLRDAAGVFGCSLDDRFCFDLICEGGANAGDPCVDDTDCTEGTCVSREKFSW